MKREHPACDDRLCDFAVGPLTSVILAELEEYANTALDHHNILEGALCIRAERWAKAVLRRSIDQNLPGKAEDALLFSSLEQLREEALSSARGSWIREWSVPVLRAYITARRALGLRWDAAESSTLIAV